MFEDYRDIVFDAYKRKRTEGSLSLNLLEPKPAKLKTECLHVYAEARSSRDDDTLRLFFGPKNDAPDFSHNIKKLDVDKFKPLVHFLTGKTSDTEEKNVELLAWLINFEKRPYVFGRNYKEGIKMDDLISLDDTVETEDETTEGIRNKNQDTIVTKLDPDEYVGLNEEIGGKEELNIFDTANQEPVRGGFDGKKKRMLKSTIRKAIVSFIVMAVTGGGTYLFLNSKNQQCMYWAGDHYQPVSCSEKIDDTPVIALDAQKAAHLKKITRPDTLTKNSLGKVWYVKVNGIPEFYTSAGEYPEDNDKRLLPITQYILDKYILRK